MAVYLYFLVKELKNLSKIPQIPYKDIHSQIMKKNEIGRGAQGIVYGCQWQGRKIAI